MKRIDWRVIVLVCIILSVAIGFLYGTGILGGSADDPGSVGDPLASQSYADATITQRVRDMDARIASLEATVKGLEEEIAILTGTAIDPEATTDAGASAGTGGSSTTTPPPSSGTGNAASSANIGKSAAVTAEVVNLRESASTSSAIKQRLTPSDTFTITKVDRNWYQVQLSDGAVGWVYADYVKVK